MTATAPVVQSCTRCKSAEAPLTRVWSPERREYVWLCVACAASPRPWPVEYT